MKGKIKICLFVLLIIGVIGVNILYKNKDSQTKPKSNLAIMIDENGNGSYTSASSIPKGSYALVEEKTVCENGGKVASYNNLTGQIGFSFLGSDRCSLYFEKVSSPTISNVTLSGSTLNASFNSKKSLCCYAITNSTSEPNDWTNISGSSYELSTSLTSSGTYYLWLKDSYGNVTRYDDAITLEKRGYETILINNGNGATTVEAAKSYIEGKKTPDFSTIATTNEGMYVAEDDLGMSYYFRGAVNNNWVKFGKDSSGSDIYWRIIRINGDGSIRMIYSGTTAPDSSTATVITGAGTQIGTSAFNSTSGKAEYVGYMYEIGKQHGLTNESTIKPKIDDWYKTLVVNDSLVADSPFCFDRTASTSKTGTTGVINNWSSTTYYYYGSQKRTLGSNLAPSLKCSNKLDNFSVSSSNGNGALTYHVGLITADEIVLAGGNNDNTNNSFYLYTSRSFWTGSPKEYSGNVYVFRLFAYGPLDSTNVEDTSIGIRPVINLSSSVKLSGNGTYNNVYTVS